MDNFKIVLQFLMDKKATIGYGVMALLTVGGERIFTMVSFQCPCNHEQNVAYGLTFLLGPAAVLFVLGFLASMKLWRLYTGCCLKPQKLCPRGNCFGCFRVLLGIFTDACVAPVMWLSVALLNGIFYECAISGMNDKRVVDLFCKNKTLTCQEELARVPCSRSKLSSSEQVELLLMFRAQSQILGWSIIITAAFVTLVGACYKNCRSEVSYLQLTFWRRYLEKEKQHFDELTAEYANKLAKRNLQSFFDRKKPEAMNLPDYKAWEEISAYYNFSKKEECYSILQHYVEKGDKEFTPEMRPVLDIENETEMS
ncbi:Protein FAM26E [Oryzias melastigma]|uniref:Protein FAM26E n=2 Tax=Oryzias melastigma TaxID=30732 RepID=A0A834C2G0_ORYME|nr:Protein FAM26E [Oryzias melastigma]